MTFKTLQPAFLPRGITIEGMRHRDLFGLADTLWGVEEIWLRVVHKRLNPKSLQHQIDDLRRVLSSSSWSHWLPIKTVHLAAECHRSVIRSSGAVKEACAEVLVEQGISPQAKDASPQGATCRIALNRDTVSVYIPLALEAWHRRAYKSHLRNSTSDAPTHGATLREDCAQALIGSLAQWLGRPVTNLPQQVLVPFAGTGTFAWEYLTLVWQLGHSIVGCRGLLGASHTAPQATLAHLHKAATARAFERAAAHPLAIWCCDWAQETCALIQQNWLGVRALLPDGVGAHLTCSIQHADVFGFQDGHWSKMLEVHDQNKPGHNAVCLLLNPPFGERLARSNPVHDYARIANLCLNLASIRPLTGLVICPDEATARSFQHGVSKRLQWESQPFAYGTLKASAIYFCSPGERKRPQLDGSKTIETSQPQD